MAEVERHVSFLAPRRYLIKVRKHVAAQTSEHCVVAARHLVAQLCKPPMHAQANPGGKAHVCFGMKSHEIATLSTIEEQCTGHGHHVEEVLARSLKVTWSEAKTHDDDK